ncbi:MAG: hypothetical protein ACOC2C_02750, partial [Cyclonatronaceae bacterium]
YDITNMQPQLFVARDFQHLIDVLEEFADGMCFRKGGADSIKQVMDSENVGTCVYSSGLQVSGVFTQLLCDAGGNEIYIGTSGLTQLCFADAQLEGHGTDAHPDGFGSPVGKLKNTDTPLEDCSDGDLLALGIEPQQNVRLEFASGVVVEGYLNALHRRNGKLLLMSFSNCRVTGPKGETLFKPEFGQYDMAVGRRISSVYSGSADKENFNVYPPKSAQTTIKDEFTEAELRLFELYKEIRSIREAGSTDLAPLQRIHETLKASYPNAWLPRLELLELLNKNHNGSGAALRQALQQELEQLKTHSKTYDNVISAGLQSLV